MIILMKLVSKENEITFRRSPFGPINRGYYGNWYMPALLPNQALSTHYLVRPITPHSFKDLFKFYNFSSDIF